VNIVSKNHLNLVHYLSWQAVRCTAYVHFWSGRVLKGLGPGTYDLGPGTYDLGPGTYDLGPGTYDLGPGTYDLGPGTYDLGPGTYDLGPGTYDLGRGLEVQASASRVEAWPWDFDFNYVTDLDHFGVFLCGFHCDTYTCIWKVNMCLVTTYIEWQKWLLLCFMFLETGYFSELKLCMQKYFSIMVILLVVQSARQLQPLTTQWCADNRQKCVNSSVKSVSQTGTTSCYIISACCWNLAVLGPCYAVGWVVRQEQLSDMLNISKCHNWPIDSWTEKTL